MTFEIFIYHLGAWTLSIAGALLIWQLIKLLDKDV